MYYDEHPDAQHDIHELHVVLLGERMKFLTKDAGVFSKKMIDFGSQVLFVLSVFSARRDDFGRRLRLVLCPYRRKGSMLLW